MPPEETGAEPGKRNESLEGLPRPRKPYDWERFRPLIEKMYLGEDRTLADIMRLMEAQYNLKGT
jgi:hypothetical protein